MGKIAFITGGGTGIGYGGAKALAETGWTVIIAGRRADVIEQAAASLGPNVSGVVLDVSDAAAVKAAIDTVLAQHGRIDLLVNSAGLNIPSRQWDEVTVEGWNTVVGANLDGLFYCIHAVLPAMRAQGGGAIINVASWAGRHYSKMVGPAYTATKHAVSAMTHQLNMAEFQNKIRATALSPAEVATEIMTKRHVPPTQEELDRMLQIDDMGRTIAFIANMPEHVCVNELVISPVHNRALGA